MMTLETALEGLAKRRFLFSFFSRLEFYTPATVLLVKTRDFDHATFEVASQIHQ